MSAGEGVGGETKAISTQSTEWWTVSRSFRPRPVQTSFPEVGTEELPRAGSEGSTAANHSTSEKEGSESVFEDGASTRRAESRVWTGPRHVGRTPDVGVHTETDGDHR